MSAESNPHIGVDLHSFLDLGATYGSIFIDSANLPDPCILSVLIHDLIAAYLDCRKSMRPENYLFWGKSQGIMATVQERMKQAIELAVLAGWKAQGVL